MLKLCLFMYIGGEVPAYSTLNSYKYVDYKLIFYLFENVFSFLFLNVPIRVCIALYESQSIAKLIVCSDFGIWEKLFIS